MWVNSGVGAVACLAMCVCSCGSCSLSEARLWHPVPFPHCLSIWTRASLSELCVTALYGPIITVENAGIRTEAWSRTVCECVCPSFCAAESCEVSFGVKCLDILQMKGDVSC